MNMNKRTAIKRFMDYLKEHNIYYELSIDNGVRMITMVYHVEDAPDRCIESCIWFYNDCAEVRHIIVLSGQKYAEKVSIEVNFYMS